jgi:ADP-heptose:LPS heptosyltransferase
VKRKRFLIIRQDRIGDVVLSTPLPMEIKKKYPSSYTAVLLTEYTKDIYLNNPDVDEVIIFPPKSNKMNPGEFFSFVKLLRQRKFDYAFMLLPEERINYMLFLVGIRVRIGVGYKFYQFITNTKSVSRRKYIPLRHEADYCLDMLRKTGVEPSAPEPAIYLTEEEKKKVSTLKKKLSPEGKKIIGINSTSGNSAPNLSPGEYKRLAEHFLDQGNYVITVTDYNPPEELDNINEVNYICRNKPLRESILNIAAVDVLISASTGPMHIASALKVPVLALFCPLTACSPDLWGPLGTRSRIILPQHDYCSNKCPGDPKKCNFSGEGGINASQVFNETIEFISSL